MTTRDDFDRQLTAWLAADAPPSEPEPLLGQVLARTARTRRRPAWRIPERWIPMSTITTPVGRASADPVASRRARRAAGRRARRRRSCSSPAPSDTLPAPFGVAVNGHLSYSAERRHHDHRFADGQRAQGRSISGPEQDFGPLYNLTGDRARVHPRRSTGAGPVGGPRRWVAGHQAGRSVRSDPGLGRVVATGRCHRRDARRRTRRRSAWSGPMAAGRRPSRPADVRVERGLPTVGRRAARVRRHGRVRWHGRASTWSTVTGRT